MAKNDVVITGRISKLVAMGIPKQTLQQYVNNTSAIVVRAERLEAPVGVKTSKDSRPGALRGSILQKETLLREIGYTVGPNVEYAKYVARGTGEYEVKGDMSLAQDTGPYHPSRTAMNRDGRNPDWGGIKPDAFHLRAAAKSQKEVYDKINMQVNRYLMQQVTINAKNFMGVFKQL